MMGLGGVLGTLGLLIMILPTRNWVLKNRVLSRIPVAALLLAGIFAELSMGVPPLRLLTEPMMILFYGPVVVAIWYLYILSTYNTSNKSLNLTGANNVPPSWLKR